MRDLLFLVTDALPGRRALRVISGGFSFFYYLSRKLREMLQKIWRGFKTALIILATYFYLVFDRLLLAPFPMVNSYSAEMLKEKNEEMDEALANQLRRVIVGAALLVIILILMWIL